MFTVTMGRSVSALSVAAAVLASSASAQVIVRTDGVGIGGGSITMSRRAVTIPDDSVRSYLTRYEPGVLDDASGDANIVTMVLDNDGTYIRSSSRHAKIIEAVPGRVVTINGDSIRTIDGAPSRLIAVNGDSARAVEITTANRVFTLNTDGPRVVTMSTNGDPVATVGSVVAVNTLRRADGESSPGMMSGVPVDEIGGIATKRYGAGELGKGPVIVTFIYLK